MADERRLIRPSDIAALAGVQPSAVSNWRKRASSGFPEPVAGSQGRPLFDYEDVVGWLESHLDREIVAVDHVQWLWSAMDASRSYWPPEEFGRFALSLLCLRKMAGASEAVARAWRGVRESPIAVRHELQHAFSAASAEKHEWAALIDLPRDLDQLEPALALAVIEGVDQLPLSRLASVADEVLERVTRSHARAGGEFGYVRSPVSRLLASLAIGEDVFDADGKPHPLQYALPGLLDQLGGKRRPSIVYDPACGLGEFLLSIGRRLPGVQLVGRELNAEALATARQRLFLSGLQADLDVADTVANDPTPGLRADAIAVEPPLGSRYSVASSGAPGSWGAIDPTDPRWQFGTPVNTASDFAWIQDAIAHLGPDGRGFVVTAALAASGSGYALKLRRDLLLRGCIEAIVELPTRLLVNTSVQLYLWVLRPPGGSRGSLKLIEALPDERSSASDDGPRVVEVTFAELLADDDLNLAPRMWLNRGDAEANSLAEEHRAQTLELNGALRRLGSAAPVVPQARDYSSVLVRSIRDLVREGSLTLLRGSIPPGSSQDDLPADVVTPKRVREGLPLPGKTAATTDPLILSKAGDVFVTAMGKIRAVVDTDGGHAVSQQVSILRAEAGVFVPDFIAWSLQGPWNERFLLGTGVPHARLGTLEIPVPPVDVQLEIVDALMAVRSIQRGAADLVEAADRYAISLLGAVRYGVDMTTNTNNEGTAR